LLFVLVFSTWSGVGQTTPDQLSALVAQLQKTPTDNTLREKIIKLASSLNPAPTVPDEALKYEGRAQAAFKTANNAAEFLTAANEYRKAVAIAPWIGGYYSDLCTIYEKAGVYFAAKQNCQWAALGDTSAAGVADAKKRMAGLDFLLEKFSKDKLSARLSEPFSTNIPGMPTGKHYFCFARYEASFDFGYTHNPDEPPVGGRRESWLVYDGSNLSTVAVLWAEAESQAAFVQFNRSSYYEPPSFISPAIDASPEKPYPGMPGQFYSQGVTSFYLKEISADGQTITVIQRGGSPDKPRAEEYRSTCRLN
jgi:hypothetical protein